MRLTLKAPASKSVSHRAAIAAALAPGRSSLGNLLYSQDLQRTLACLQSLGARIEQTPTELLIDGLAPGGAPAADQTPLELDVGESGTTCRLLTPIAALSSRRVLLKGRGRMHERPIAELSSSLEELGCKFQWLGQPGYPPFILDGRDLHGGRTAISLEQSSQYLSGLLLLGPMLHQGLEIAIQGEKAVSWPYAALTLKVMQDFGCNVEVLLQDQAGKLQPTSPQELQDIVPGQTLFRVPAGQYSPREYQVEGDWSNASYLLAAGLFLPRGIEVQGLDPESGQGDRNFLHILAKMGAQAKTTSQGVLLEPCSLQGAELDMGSCPDLVPTVAVLASMAQGATRISNVAHLRLKESDRLQALAQEIVKTGAGVKLRQDGLDIQPVDELPLTGRVSFHTYGDHRLAMSLSIFELAGLEVELDQPGCVDKSFPEFWTAWGKIRQELGRG
ncbi:MAG: 3-phosphoshikimate 1-carboxyvinyltransferase [Desulfohalobiaceae bacterium]